MMTDIRIGFDLQKSYIGYLSCPSHRRKLGGGVLGLLKIFKQTNQTLKIQVTALNNYSYKQYLQPCRYINFQFKCCWNVNKKMYDLRRKIGCVLFSDSITKVHTTPQTSATQPKCLINIKVLLQQHYSNTVYITVYFYSMYCW